MAPVTFRRPIHTLPLLLLLLALLTPRVAESSCVHLGCFGYMMRQRNYNNSGLLIPRSPQTAECGLLDRVHLTQKEAAEDDPCPLMRMQLAPIPPDYAQGDPECPEDPPPNSSPIVVDLDRGGFDFTGLDDPVRFDIDADGVAETLSWSDPSSRDALLAYDHNGNGVIGDGGELFGDSSRLLSGGTAAHGFHALAELDSPAFGGNAPWRSQPPAGITSS
jgi:hypothetical protein